MAYAAKGEQEGSMVVEVVSLEGEKIALKVRRFFFGKKRRTGWRFGELHLWNFYECLTCFNYV